MWEKPLYRQIWKTIKLFNDWKFWTQEIIDARLKYVTKKRWRFRKEVHLHNINLVLNYLLKNQYIIKDWDNNYILTNDWEVLQDKMGKKFKRLESIIEDYPTLLWWMVGWIIGAIFAIIIERIIQILK